MRLTGHQYLETTGVGGGAIEPVIDAKRNHLEVGVMHTKLIGN
jgi:hypothetical protein